MPESFDPDAWPHGGSSKASNGSGAKPAQETPRKQQDDPYDAFGFDDDPVNTSATSNADDDFASFSYDFDDDPVQQPQSRKQAAAVGSRRNDFDDDPYADEDSYSSDKFQDDYAAPGKRDDYSQGRDDYSQSRDKYDDDNYDDDDRGYDDNYDDFDDYDREPSQGGNLKRTLIGVAAVVFLIGALGIGASYLFGGDDPPAQVAEEPAPQTPAPTEAPATPAPPTDQNAQVPSGVRDTLNQALVAWGNFSVSGDPALMEPYFLPTSTQMQHFRTTEGPAIRNNPPVGGPFTMSLGQDTTTVKTGNDWVVAGTVTAAREQEPPQQFRWEFTLTKQTESSPWQIMKVRQF